MSSYLVPSDQDNLATSINLPLMHEANGFRRQLKPPAFSTKAIDSDRLNKELTALQDFYIKEKIKARHQQEAEQFAQDKK